MICTQTKICILEPIQFSGYFVKSGAVVKLYTNAYASTVYWQITVFSSEYNKFVGFRQNIQLKHHFSEQWTCIYNLNGGFYKDLQPKQNLWTQPFNSQGISSKAAQLLSSTQMHTQVRFIDKLQCSHLNKTNLQDSDSIFSQNIISRTMFECFQLKWWILYGFVAKTEFVKS